MTDRNVPTRHRSPVALAGALAGVALIAATALGMGSRGASVAPAGVKPNIAGSRAVPPGLDPVADIDEQPTVDGRILPSAHYRQAAEHASDVIAFDTGGQVTVPFRPRPDDRSTIGGTAGVVDEGDPGGAAFLDQPLGQAVPGELASTSSVADDGTATTAGVGPSRLRREVFGFLPYWQLNDPNTALEWRTLSTIAYFSVGCTSSGGLWKRNLDGSVSTGWAGWTSSRMTSVIDAAHRHGTRVVLTVSCFGWSAAGAATQASLLRSAGGRATLARQVAAAVHDRGADGVNLDFEPIVSGSADEFTALVRAVRRELDAIRPGYQLTFDALGSIGNQPIAAATAPGGADAIVIMGYDYRTQASPVAGSIAPLGGPQYDLTDTVEAFTARVPAAKLILGVPYYGRAWSTATNDVHSRTLDPSRYGGVAEPLYAQAVDLARASGRRYDRVEKAPWTAYRRRICTAAHGCVTTWRQLYYDDAASLKLRYDLVNQAGLRGAAIWALGYDGTRPELREALADKFLSAAVPHALTVGGFGRVVVDGLRLRASPSLAGVILTRLRAGTALDIIGGPVRRDGYTWFRVVNHVERRGWVAAFGNGWTHVVPRRPTENAGFEKVR